MFFTYIFQGSQSPKIRHYVILAFLALSVQAQQASSGFIGGLLNDLYADYSDPDSDSSNSSNWSSLSACNRQCSDNEPPRTCYVHLDVEFYTTMGGACEFCRPTIQNQLTGVPQCECILSDGVEKGILIINRMLPGPFIKVCQNDKLVIDVKNSAEGTGTTIHWHGIFQNGYQYYDGVPYVTQCPIHAGNTFRYHFRVKNPGTHFYHSHAGIQMMDGMYGALIVAQPPSLNPFNGFYDKDEHILLVSDLFHTVAQERYPGRYHFFRGQAAENFLINGQGNWTDPQTQQSTNVPYFIFDVEQGFRYRFRIINSCSSVCLAEIAFENHYCTLISVDGEDVEATDVNVLNTGSGNRYDCVITANQPVGSYWIRAKGLGECEDTELQQFAILRYKGASAIPNSPKPKYTDSIINPITLYPLNTDTCGSPNITNNQICINQLKKKIPVENEVLKVLPDYRLILPFDFYNYNDTGLPNNLFAPGSFQRFFVAIDRSHLQSFVGNISYLDAPAPLISQPDDAYSNMCPSSGISTCTAPCTCTHAYHLPLNVVFEVILVDTGNVPILWHPFHLHGFSFTVFDMGQINGSIQLINDVINRHTQRLATGYYKDPPNVDTILVPSGGYVIMRVYTNNPGWWFFHCHFTWHTASGMNVVLNVGQPGDLPPVPLRFPTCYNYQPDPDFPY